MILAAGAGASAGPLGFLVVLLIGIATVLLIRNMNGRLRRMPRQFPDSGSDRDPSADQDPAADRETQAGSESTAKDKPPPA